MSGPLVIGTGRPLDHGQNAQVLAHTRPDTHPQPPPKARGQAKEQGVAPRDQPPAQAHHPVHPDLLLRPARDARAFPVCEPQRPRPDAPQHG